MTPYNINAFQNYSNYFYNNVLTYYNYSSVSLILIKDILLLNILIY